MKDYFNRLMEALEQLERSIFRINDLGRELEYQANKLVNRQALIVALILPVVLFAVYTYSGSGMFGNNVLSQHEGTVAIRMFGAGFIVWTLGVALDFLFKYLFYRDYLPNGKSVHKARLLPEFEQKKSAIISEVEPVIKENIEPLHLPEKYVDVPTVSVLMDYVNSGKAKTLEEAIKLSQEEQALAEFENHESLLEKFRKLEHETV